MKKLGDLILVGTCLILAGITIIIAESVGVNKAKIFVPILFFLSGIYTLKHSRSNKDLEITSKFEFLKGVGLIIFATVIFFSDSLINFLMYVAYFILMYGLLEIIFPFTVLNSKNKITRKVLIFRIVAGFAVSIGAIILLVTTYSSEYKGLMIAGFLTILIGISNIIYATRLKNQTAN
ncbi:hypothetical protein BFR04_09350 [Gaetbulibacter sp. 4G1]|nr:hypothetical protein [Gaetbulibacter sp. 4G1]PIA77635.1 hypothetical protein BFR04_09350 [Gaetbulibacter sp. 4G1]